MSSIMPFDTQRCNIFSLGTSSRSANTKHIFKLNKTHRQLSMIKVNTSTFEMFQCKIPLTMRHASGHQYTQIERSRIMN